jgi:hypothetical protein
MYPIALKPYRGDSMGAEPYSYFVPYQTNLQSALDQLRAEVFTNGDFNGAELGPANPEEALEMADADGTASILDIQRISKEPDFFCAAPFSAAKLQEYFGSDRPTREDVEQGDEYWDELERGQARYVVVYNDNEPSELYFAGYSFD